MKYHSKKDWWVVLVIWIAILLPPGFGFIAIHIESEPPLVVSGWIALGAALLLILALSALSFPLYYEVEAPVLRIRCGLLHQEIPLSAIQAVFPTHNPLVAAAWSLDRLQVNYQVGKRSLCALIAPKDKDRFLHELAQHDTGLQVKANSILRLH
jgi:PH (Pleckstrin Homology) domain-containing protein